MSDKHCPRCGLWNSETSTRCDCGYDFSTGQIRSPLGKPVKPLLTPAEKWRDVLIGFGGWWLINGSFWLMLGRDTSGYGLIFNLFCLPANLIGLVILAFKRPWMALGVASTYVVNLAASVMYNAVNYSQCWVPFFIGGR